MKGFWSVQAWSHLRFAALLFLTCFQFPVQAETLHIAKQANYINPEKVRVEVRQQCEPDIRLPAMMLEDVAKLTAIQNPVLVESSTVRPEGLMMATTIFDLEIPHGTGFSTEKRTLRIKTVLYRGGVVLDEYERYLESRGAISFVQKVFRIRRVCDYVDHLIENASRNTIERFLLMKLLPGPIRR